jgi:ATP-dependent RNA helicase DeaD
MLEARGPEAMAAAFARLARGRLPDPEDVQDAPPPRPPREERGAPVPRGRGADGAVWFRLDVGRAGNADPKWIIPYLCRRGHITKAEIGAIRIMAQETRVEIAGHAAGRFAAALRHSGREDDVQVEPMGALPYSPGAGHRGPHRAPGRGGYGPPRRPPAREAEGYATRRRPPRR